MGGMFKLFRNSSASEHEAASPQPKTEAVLYGVAPTTSAGVDTEKVLSTLLTHSSVQDLLQSALEQLASALGGVSGGYAVMRREQDRVVATLNYPAQLLGLELKGPWQEARPRLTTGGGAELLPLNDEDTQALLSQAGLQQASASLVLPLTDRGRRLGVLVLDRVGVSFGPAEQEVGQKIAALTAPLLALVDSRDEALNAAHTISTAVVEAIESLDFDSVGHAQAVTKLALQLGRVIGLSDRELNELGYAATLHDIGKILGEEGHAQIGANLLHGLDGLSAVRSAIRHHHERWDGQGTPDQLSGADIPLYARIITIANAYVHVQDMDVIREQSGKALDPSLVTALEKLEKADKLNEPA